jgi:hypothetical protein
MEALTKQNGARLLGKLKKKLKPTYPKFLQEETGNPHIFFCLARVEDTIINEQIKAWFTLAILSHCDWFT